MSLTVDFSNDDLPDLLVITKVLADRQKEGSAGFNLTEYSLEETAALISEARRQLAKAKGERLQLQRNADQQHRLRASLGQLPDREAERQWNEQMTAEGTAQGEKLAADRNQNKSGRSLIGVDPEIQNQVFTFIEKQR